MLHNINVSCTFYLTNSVKHAYDVLFLRFPNAEMRRETGWLQPAAARVRSGGWAGHHTHRDSTAEQSSTHTQKEPEHCESTQHVKKRTKRSKVWLYFGRVDADNARCNKWNKLLASKGGNTSNLSKHLAKVHQIQTELFNKLARAPSNAVTPSTSSGNYEHGEHGND